MKTKIEVIGKNVALGYLENNTKNRPVKKGVVDFYTNQMNNGLWKENTGESIKISKDGTLIDGQHRLLAISKTNRQFSMLVVYDMDEDVFDVLDTGRIRGATDVFALDGVKNYNVVVSNLKEYLSLKSGVTQLNKDNTQGYKISNSFLLEMYNKNKEYFDENSLIAMRLSKNFERALQKSTIGGLRLLLLDSVNSDKTDFFLENLCSLSTSENNEIEILRKVLIRDKMSIKKMPARHRNALIFKTWNYYVNNISSKCLKFTDGLEKYPIIL